MKASMKKAHGLYSFLCPKRTQPIVPHHDSSTDKLNFSLDDFEDPKLSIGVACKQTHLNRLNNNSDVSDVVNKSKDERNKKCDESEEADSCAGMSYEDFLCSQDEIGDEEVHKDHGESKCELQNGEPEDSKSAVCVTEQNGEAEVSESTVSETEQNGDDSNTHRRKLTLEPTSITPEKEEKLEKTKKRATNKRKLTKKSSKETRIAASKQQETSSNDENKREDVAAEKPVCGIHNYFTKTLSKPLVEKTCDTIAMTVNADVHASPKRGAVFSIFKRAESKTGFEKPLSPPSENNLTAVKNCSGKLQPKRRSNVAVENDLLDLSISEEQDSTVANKDKDLSKTTVAKSKATTRGKRKIEEEKIRLDEPTECVCTKPELTPPDCCLLTSDESPPADMTSKKTTQTKLNFGIFTNKANAKPSLKKPNSTEQTKDSTDQSKECPRKRKLKTCADGDQVPIKCSSLLQKKRLRAMYRAVIVQKANVFKKTPIKMKLLRLAAAESEKAGDGDDFTKTKPGVKAQRIIERAKSKKVAKAILTSEVEGEDGCDLRRSVRRSSMAAKSAILLCYEEPTLSSWSAKEGAKTPRRQNTRLAATGGRNHSDNDDNNTSVKIIEEDVVKKKETEKTLAKTTAKLASIFQSKPCPPTVDPETLQRRREFLLSSTPEAMKAELRTRDVQLGSDPPWPPAHVLQSEEVATMGTRPKELVLSEPVGLLQWKCSNWPMGLFVDAVCQSPTEKRCIAAKTPFTAEVVKRLLAEISARNPTFPVSEMYKELLERKQHSSNEVESSRSVCSFSVTADQPTITTNTRKRKRVTSLSLRGKKVRCSKGDDVDGVKFPSVAEGMEEEVIIVDGDERVDDDGTVHDADLLWTDKYAPATSSGIVGHLGSLHRLRSWLRQWKQLTERQVSKESRKERRKKLDTSMDDFTCSKDNSEASSDEDEGLTNTMLLTGPHGCGKTASVYAMADQLGFKVFEVNASSLRSGKRVLSDLQEATQSQRVCSKNTPQTTPNPTQGISGMMAKGKDKAVSSEKAVKTTKRCVNANKDSGAHKKKASSRLDLSSTSLILFEEVDIVFEEDKGLWAAIQTFVETTKRPIILTTNDVNFCSRFDCPLDENKFRPPSMLDIASYLQTLCLAEANLRSEFHDVLSLVEFQRGDIRRSMLAAQFWAQSGGNPTPRDAPVKSNNIAEAKPQDSRFIAIRTTYEDDSSCETAFLSLTKERTRKGETEIKVDEVDGDSGCSAPPVHDNCFASVTAAANSSRCSNILQELCTLDNSPTTSSLINHYRTLGVDFLYSNMHRILLLDAFEPIRPAETTDDTISESSAQNSKDGNLCDSNDSTSAPSSEKHKKCTVVKESVKSIDALARLHDDMSFVDSLHNPALENSSEDALTVYNHIQPGLGDHVITNHECDWSEYDGLNDVTTAIELISFRQTRETLDSVRFREGEGHRDIGQVGSPPGPGELRLSHDTDQQIRGRHSVHRAVRYVHESLRCSDRKDLTVDYVPTLRTICQLERTRRQMKVKRRFFHYFDHIQLRLKPSVIDQLATPIS